MPQHGRYSYNYFIKLEMSDSTGRIISDNIYWFYSQHSSLVLLPGLRNTEVESSVSIARDGEEYVISVELENTTGRLAFMKCLS